MIEQSFVAGFVLGIVAMAAVAGVVAVAVYKPRHRRHDIPDWTEQAYEPPVATTRIVNRHRSFDI